jgi:phosphoserine phosphatase RsbU/P
VFDRDGNVVLRAHARANEALERAMATVVPGTTARFTHRGDRYVAATTDSGGGEQITVAQSLRPVETFLARQRSASILSTALLIVLIFIATTIGWVVWVSAPLNRLVSGVAAIRQRCFETRVRGVGMSELGLLAQGVNDMARSLEKVENRRRAEMNEARSIQQGLLPHHSDTVDGYELAATFLPAESVGGDLYDVVERPNGSVVLAVFDVSGHGVSAALCTALLRNVLRREINERPDLTDVRGELNTAFADIGQTGYFATCVLVHLSPSGDLQYVNAGHEPIAIVRTSGEFQALEGGGLPLGVEHPTQFDAESDRLEKGDRLFVYTDGIHEVFDANGTIFGRQRLARALVDSADLPVHDQLRVVIDHVRSFNQNDGFDDDVTLLCASRK